MNIENMTDRELVSKCNELARTFYQMQGYVVPDGFKFYKATHPQEVGMWSMAVAAFDFITDSDTEDALAQIEDDDDE